MEEDQQRFLELTQKACDLGDSASCQVLSERLADILVGLWKGSFDLESPCEDGNYSGGHYNICFKVFQEGTGYGATFDHDQGSVQAACAFWDGASGTLVGQRFRLTAPDPVMVLDVEVSGEKMQGTYKSGTCPPWPVQMTRSR